MITSLLEHYVAPLLSAHGFQRSGLIWNRVQPGMVHVLDIQIGKQSSPQQADFTINVGVLLEAVWQAIQGGPLPKIVQEVDCFPRLRVGQLLGDGPLHKDVWWTLSNPGDIDAVGVKLQDVLKSKCIPFLDGLDSPIAALAAAEDPMLRRFPGERLSYAALKYLTGRHGEATEILAEMLANPKLKGWHKRVRGVSERQASIE